VSSSLRAKRQPLYAGSLIGPFRKHIVYRSLLRAVGATWEKTFGAA
jgi:hypothetical protein